MFKLVLIASLLVSVAFTAPISDDELEQEELRQKQIHEAKYDFGSNINDEINDVQNVRNETRVDGKVIGYYSYSDGFVRRTVHYEADQNGYRVVKEDMQNIGDGPTFNPDGVADVESSISGAYSIKLDNDDKDKHYKGVRE